jgi:hypothetical protein
MPDPTEGNEACRCGVCKTGFDNAGEGSPTAIERASKRYDEFTAWAHSDVSSGAYDALSSLETKEILIGLLDDFCKESKTLCKFAKADRPILAEMLRAFLLYGYFLGSGVEGPRTTVGETASAGDMIEWEETVGQERL